MRYDEPLLVVLLVVFRVSLTLSRAGNHRNCEPQALVCVFITSVPVTKLFAWGVGDSGGHVLRETTSGSSDS
jgi:hypothetical protein